MSQKPETTEYIGVCGSVTKVSCTPKYCVTQYLVVSLVVIVKDYHLYFKSLCCFVSHIYSV